MVVFAVVVGSLLAGASPAPAVPAPEQRPSDSSGPDEWGPGWRPQPELPEPVVVPSTGETVTPLDDVGDLEPIEPEALPETESPGGIGLAPEGTAAPSRRAGAAQPQDIGPPEDGAELYCTPDISTSVDVFEEPIGGGSAPPYTQQVAVVDYLATLECNYNVAWVSGAAAVVDHTPGFDGEIVDTANTFAEHDFVDGYSMGTLEVPGEWYDGARDVEVVFEMILDNRIGLTWGSCDPLPGLVYHFCDGLGTETLHVMVGTDVFGTGLRDAEYRYVALGDSYAGGTGAPPYISGSGQCLRSSASYPHRIAGVRVPVQGSPPVGQPTFVACDGARIDNISTPQLLDGANLVPPQWSALNRDATRLATVSTGGNDLGFADRLGECVREDCYALTNGGPLIDPIRLQMTQSQLRSVYLNIRARMAPDGYLLVINYPLIFSPNPRELDDCATGIDDRELVLILDAWRTARNMVATAVAAANSSRIRLVDMYDAFSGHEVCTTDAWVHNVEFSAPRRSFHPTAEGYDAYTNRILQAISQLR
jgi:hypothetical protein